MTGRLLATLRKIMVLAVPTGAVLLLWALIIDPLNAIHSDLSDRSNDLAKLRHRYEALIMQRTGLEVELAAAKAATANQDLFYLDANAHKAATLLQQKLGDLVARHGGQMRMARIEIKPKKANQQSCTVHVTLAASMQSFARLLYEIETAKPVLFVDSISVHGAPALLRLQEAKDTSNPNAPTLTDPVLEIALSVSAFVLTQG